MFKTISTAALVVALASPSFAGALSDPIIEVAPIVEATSSSSAGIGAPAILGAIVAVAAVAALVSDDDDDAPTVTPGTGD